MVSVLIITIFICILVIVLIFTLLPGYTSRIKSSGLNAKRSHPEERASSLIITPAEEIVKTTPELLISK